MPNGSDKNWMRICFAVNGFRSRHGRWPKEVRISPTLFEDVVGHVLTPAGFALISNVFAIVSDRDLSEKVAIVAVGEFHDEFRYGEESGDLQDPEPSTFDYFGIAVLRGDLD